MRRPEWNEYFINLAREAARRSNCIRRQVGALIVKDRAIISTGYNGTPMGVKNCCDGGCPRCQSAASPGESYDTCLCVPAEENAILLAARHGVATDQATIYTTLRPCISSIKSAIQAGVKEIVYSEDFRYEAPLEEAYRNLVLEAGLKVRQYALKEKK